LVGGCVPGNGAGTDKCILLGEVPAAGLPGYVDKTFFPFSLAGLGRLPKPFMTTPCNLSSNIQKGCLSVPPSQCSNEKESCLGRGCYIPQISLQSMFGVCELTMTICPSRAFTDILVISAELARGRGRGGCRPRWCGTAAT
jgi:hypothetical protein